MAGFKKKITYRWWIWYCHVWLAEGSSLRSGMVTYSNTSQAGRTLLCLFLLGSSLGSWPKSKIETSKQNPTRIGFIFSTIIWIGNHPQVENPRYCNCLILTWISTDPQQMTSTSTCPEPWRSLEAMSCWSHQVGVGQWTKCKEKNAFTWWYTLSKPVSNDSLYGAHEKLQ